MLPVYPVEVADKTGYAMHAACRRTYQTRPFWDFY